MEHYWNIRAKLTTLRNPTDNITQDDNNSVLSEYDCHRQTLFPNQTEEEAWQAEKFWYLKDLPANVTKEMDIVEWWQVSVAVECLFFNLKLVITIFYRTMDNHTLPFIILQSTSSPVKLHLSLANISSHLGVKLQQNEGHNLGRHSLKSWSWWNLPGLTTSGILQPGTQTRW